MHRFTPVRAEDPFHLCTQEDEYMQQKSGNVFDIVLYSSLTILSLLYLKVMAVRCQVPLIKSFPNLLQVCFPQRSQKNFGDLPRAKTDEVLAVTPKVLMKELF